ATGPDGQPWPELDRVRPWDSLSDDERRLFARMAEVFAGYISYTDAQIGRVIDLLDESGQLDNTIVVVVSDNGSSAEGGPNGTFNEWRFFNGVPDTTELTLPHIDELGTPASYNHYNTGWAWAFDTPFPYWKRFAGYEGGVADMCLVAWPARIRAQPDPRHQYIHAVDIVPTIYELLAIDPPSVLKGYPQSPLDGQSFAATLTDPNAPGRDTQFYAMLGQRSIYHQGWLACTVHPPISGWGNFDKDVWQLYHLERDRAQSHNLADREHERLQTLKDLWFYYAGVYNGLPLDDRTALEQVLAERPHAGAARNRYTYYPDCSDVPEEAGVPINGRSFTIVAGVDIDATDAEGVLFASGGIIGGHSLYIKDRRLHYVYNWIGTHLQDVVADRDITPGRHALTAEFSLQGQNDDPAMPGFSGTLTLYIDNDVVGSGKVVTQPGAFCLVGDGICVGRDSASPVTPDYKPPFRFTGGQIERVVVDVSGEQYVDHEAQVRAWLMRD
ncbi:MAG TPA: sulfatase-like hydrolase/transferase, partial [Acidimicrobiales bacterium]|nr:sulfatase-like hydrolase/transferase [Acidimicrobiales bacterium]